MGRAVVIAFLDFAVVEDLDYFIGTGNGGKFSRLLRM